MTGEDLLHVVVVVVVVAVVVFVVVVVPRRPSIPKRPRPDSKKPSLVLTSPWDSVSYWCVRGTGCRLAEDAAGWNYGKF